MPDLLSIFFAGHLVFQPKPAAPAPAPRTVHTQAARVATAPSADEVLAGVQKFYAGITTVQAKFRQEVTNTTFNRSDISDGTVMIGKPGKMRWEYQGKPRKGKVTTAKSFISDGKQLIVVDQENKQVIKKDLSKNLLPTAITFLYGKGNLADDFKPEIDTTGAYGTKADLVLKLTPKQQSNQYKNLYLVVDPKEFHVKESILVDAAGNTNHFRFFDDKFNETLDERLFLFNIKSVKNYRVIDGDQPAKDDKAKAGKGE